MQRIGKNNEIVKLFKEVQKTNRYKNLICSDDLEILKICVSYKLSIPYLLYSFEEDFQASTKGLLNQLIKQALEAYEVSNETCQSLLSKENHAKIIAMIELPEFKTSDLKDFVLVLDHLEIPGNIGTLYRTADACGITGIIIVDPITKPNNPKITASSRGTNLIIPSICMSYQDALEFLLKENYTIYLGEPELGSDYQSYSYKGKIAIVVGNERFGIQQDWYQHSHKKVYIPMIGHNNSINVSVAGSILIYEAFMKRTKLNNK